MGNQLRALFESPLTEEVKHLIDGFTRYEMCRQWRFSGLGTFVYGPVYEYWNSRFRELGGFSPEISKSLGWQS